MSDYMDNAILGMVNEIDEECESKIKEARRKAFLEAAEIVVRGYQEEWKGLDGILALLREKAEE